MGKNIQVLQAVRRSSSFGISAPGDPNLVRYPDFHPLRKLTQRGLQRISNLPQPPHRRVDDPSLDPADVCSVETALAAEALLRVSCHFAEFAHDGPDGPYL
jgi:hypothetical protein